MASLLEVSLRFAVPNLTVRLQREGNLAVPSLAHDLITPRHFRRIGWASDAWPGVGGGPVLQWTTAGLVLEFAIR
jgi:hypothetical protein